MLMPKRTKYRKQHRLSYEGKAKGNTELNFGEYGLMAREGAYITAQQIEVASYRNDSFYETWWKSMD